MENGLSRRSDLLARLEAAEAGSRELDVAITREFLYPGRHPIWYTAHWTRDPSIDLSVLPEEYAHAIAALRAREG